MLLASYRGDESTFPKDLVGPINFWDIGAINELFDLVEVSFNLAVGVFIL